MPFSQSFSVGSKPMSVTPVTPVRRVRDLALDAAAVMTFSALTSLAFAVAFLLLTHLGR